MNLLFHFSVALPLLTSCQTTVSEKKISNENGKLLTIDSSLVDAHSLGLILSPHIKYDDAKLKAKEDRIKASRLLTNDYTALQNTIETIILNELIPHWYGTQWDFNGHTEIPNVGFVACGYFVSTVMKHAGFKVNRIKMAQQNPYYEALTVACGDSIYTFRSSSSELQEIFRRNFKEGLYFVGLENHVGFLLFRKNELYFIHSNYTSPAIVKLEKAKYSDAFNNSSLYQIAAFSTNPKLLRNWVRDIEIPVHTWK